MDNFTRIINFIIQLIDMIKKLFNKTDDGDDEPQQ